MEVGSSFVWVLGPPLPPAAGTEPVVHEDHYLQHVSYVSATSAWQKGNSYNQRCCTFPARGSFVVSWQLQAAFLSFSHHKERKSGEREWLSGHGWRLCWLRCCDTVQFNKPVSFDSLWDGNVQWHTMRWQCSVTCYVIAMFSDSL